MSENIPSDNQSMCTIEHSDYPAHSCTLDSQGWKATSCGQWRHWSDCAVWTESSMVANVRRYVFSCCSSNGAVAQPATNGAAILPAIKNMLQTSAAVAKYHHHQVTKETSSILPWYQRVMEVFPFYRDYCDSMVFFTLRTLQFHFM